MQSLFSERGNTSQRVSFAATCCFNTKKRSHRLSRESRRPRGAEGFFRRALTIRLEKLEPNDFKIAMTLYELGQCLREAGRPGDAEMYVRRALQIVECKRGPSSLQVITVRSDPLTVATLSRISATIASRPSLSCVVGVSPGLAISLWMSNTLSRGHG